MATLKSSKFPVPKSWEDFEILCEDLFRAESNDPGTQRNGRTGQSQGGVDLFGRPDGGQHYAGVQVRNKSAVTVAELREEVDKARSFFPALKSFVLATTAPNDATLQEEARRLTSVNIAEGLFSVEVWSWDEIESKLADHPQVLVNHYPQFSLADTPPKEKSELERVPSFRLEHQPAEDGWVHMKVTNLAEPSDFHCDITRVIGAREEQTTPYPAKWRGNNVEKKFIVREALIDLARVLWHPGPDINSDSSGVFFLKTHGHRAGGWDSGYWELFSHDQPGGWAADAVDHNPQDQAMPARVRLFFEELQLVIRIIRLSSNEERQWRVTLGFPLPPVDSSRPGSWILPPKGTYEQRVIVEEA